MLRITNHAYEQMCKKLVLPLHIDFKMACKIAQSMWQDSTPYGVEIGNSQKRLATCKLTQKSCVMVARPEETNMLLITILTEDEAQNSQFVLTKKLRKEQVSMISNPRRQKRRLKVDYHRWDDEDDGWN